jgi:hypothetical protein
MPQDYWDKIPLMLVTLLNLARTLGALAFALIALVSVWFTVQKWRHYFRNQPISPRPSWADRFISYLWWAAIPWWIDCVIKVAKDLPLWVGNLHTPQGKAKLFVTGFLVFCYLIGLASKYLTPDQSVTSN